MNNAGGSIMWLYQAFVALEIAEQRRREADQDRLAALARAGRTKNDRSFRRTTAVAFASISTAAASLVRRLDECVADDLAERLGPDRVATSH
jgi:hypothetical protein